MVTNQQTDSNRSMVVQRAGMALIFAVGWVMLTGQNGWDSLVLGLIVGMSLVLLLGIARQRDKTRPGVYGLTAAVLYVLEVLREIIVSDFFVASRILSPKPLENDGMVELTVGCECEVIAALSAHAITAAPGSMVVDFDDDNQTMIIHVIDRDVLPDLQTEQLRRFGICERMLD